jgi:glycerol-1-phosphate dehydrogenase [NAD(P)+]
MMESSMPYGNQESFLQQLLGQTLPCTCEVEHVVPTKAVLLAAGALNQVAWCCKRYLPGQKVVLVSDDMTHNVAGGRVAEIMKQAGYSVEVHTIPMPSKGRVIADEDTVAAVQSSIGPDIESLIAVGAGTINDVVKLASFRTNRPYVVCATAPSMNGFTSAIAAIMSQGVKRTVPAHPPVAVVADLDILMAAPAMMTRAGLGDMLSKPVSTADWKLTHLIKGEYYCDLPLRIVAQAEQACQQHAVAIGRGCAEGVGALTEALLLSGISMVVAGSSSPASGGEHLLSHYWDMTAHWHGRQEQLHGAQVGVATLVTATLYEKLQRLDPCAIDLASLRHQYPDWPHLEGSLRQIHGPLANAVVAEARKKYVPLDRKEQEWSSIIEHWSSLWKELEPILVPASHIRQVLVAAGAPTTIGALAISPEELRTAFLHARDIRGRYTVLDFAHDLGVLEELCEEVLAESGVLN